MSAMGGQTWKDLTQDLPADLERVATMLRTTCTIHDPLTGLVSAAYLEIRLAEEVARSERMRIPFSVIALGIMSHTGAAAGLSDALVRDTAMVLRTNLRSMDVLARANRLEFVCLVPEAGVEQSSLIAKRLTDAVAALSEQLQGLRLVAGMASYPDDGGDAVSLMAAARLALLRNRTAGVTRRIQPDMAKTTELRDQAAGLRTAAGAMRQGAGPTQQVADTSQLVAGVMPVAQTHNSAMQYAVIPQQMVNASADMIQHGTALQQMAVSSDSNTAMFSAVAPLKVEGYNARKVTPQQPMQQPLQQPFAHTLSATPVGEPVAVGFITGERFPVSYWHQGELVAIEAILEEHAGEAETSLLAQTGAGLVQLTCRGRRWFVAQHSGA